MSNDYLNPKTPSDDKNQVPSPYDTDQRKKQERGGRLDSGLKVYLLSILSVLVAFVILFVSLLSIGLFENIKAKVPNTQFDPEEIPSIVKDLINKGTPEEPENIADVNGPSLNIIDFPASKSALSPEEIYSTVSPSIVNVNLYQTKDKLESGLKSMGSGVIMTIDGYIVTNAHVINNSKTSYITVTTQDKTQYDAKVVGYDKTSDLAVIKIDATGLTPAIFGNSAQISAGAEVFAIGNPGGMDFSITKGIVSAVNRSLGDSPLGIKYIQTDASVSPGNSGGALCNQYGQVVGIITSKIVDSGFEGISFAIPTVDSKTIIDNLIHFGYIPGRVKLGIMGKVLTKTEADYANVPQGMIISEVSDESDLKSKDVAVGDIITKVNGVEVTSFDVLYNELQKHSASDTVTLTIYRQKSKISNDTFDVQVSLLEDIG